MPPLGDPPDDPPGGLLLPGLPCTAESLHAAVKRVATAITSNGLSQLEFRPGDPLCFIMLRLLMTVPDGDVDVNRPTLKALTSLALSKNRTPEFRLFN